MSVITLTVPTDPNTGGTAVSVYHLVDKSVQISGLTSGTFSLGKLYVQGSNNNTSWVNLSDPITEDDIISVPTPMQFVRIYTVSTTGTPTATLVGHTRGS